MCTMWLIKLYIYVFFYEHFICACMWVFVKTILNDPKLILTYLLYMNLNVNIIKQWTYQDYVQTF